MVITAGPSHFTTDAHESVTSTVAFAHPFNLCSDVENGEDLKGKIAVAERGECTFVDKARRAMNAGAKAVIIFDNVPGTSIYSQPLFALSGDGKDDVKIPTCFLFTTEANQLKMALTVDTNLEVSSKFAVSFKIYRII